MTKEEQLREELAAYAHEAWSGWMKYLFSKCDPQCLGDESTDGELVVPRWAVDRWTRQMSTPYTDLPEEEKESDRKEADKMIWLFLKDGLRKMADVIDKVMPADPCAQNGHNFVQMPESRFKQYYCTKCGELANLAFCTEGCGNTYYKCTCEKK